MRIVEVMNQRTEACSPRDATRNVCRRMARHGLSDLPVVNRRGWPIGIVERGDLERPVEKNRSEIRDVMRRAPRMGPHDPIDMAIDAMRAGHFESLPIAGSDGRLIGTLDRRRAETALARRRERDTDLSYFVELL